ncbi:leucine-rich repeat neuronal protein 2 [Osmerus mordax]|uniref:leucine-rich repeat neuronal protein 2 n=1 Tax=Osmerus mordax TaxID=8014 RepID=UPI00350ECB52
MWRPTPIVLQSQLLLFVCMCVCVCGLGAVVIQSLPWHVSCPGHCVCQIKPWFSPESVYCEAPTVDCNDLLLTKLPSALPHNTHTLRLQSNLLSALDSTGLHTLPNLTELDLSQNHFNSVRSLTQSLALASLLSLHLEENQLTHLPLSSFFSLPALQELFLSHNRLRSLAPGAFTGLDFLLRLHLNNNRLTSIDPRWFTALPSLEVLMLGGNPVEALPEQGFQALGSLRSLVLGDMGLKGLPEGALEGLDNLESLSFYDNLLTSVPTQALRRVAGLKFLDLNKNRIGLVQTGDFKNMVHLKELGLNNMEELVSIEKAALENLPELTKLEITNNPRLSYIHPQAFLQLGRLESLMLNSNSLTALHQHTLLSLPSLQEVSLHSNPLRCDCLFRWVAGGHSHTDSDTHTHLEAQADAHTPRAVRFIQPQATLCSEPPELRARRVRELSLREMSASCLPLIPPGPLPPYMGVREGGSLVLHCRALAEPQPTIYWVTPTGLKLGPNMSHAANHTPEPSPMPSLQASPAKSHHHKHTHPSGHAQGLSIVPGPGSSSHYNLLPEGTLQIVRVTPKEAGLYTCVAENALGADTRSVTVGVHGRGEGREGPVPSSPVPSSPVPSSPVPSSLQEFPFLKSAGGLQVKKVGEHYAVLTWMTGHNLPFAKLSWHATHSDTHTQTHSTRILAGTQSFNLTHLQPGTLYRVCLHTEIREGPRQAGSRQRDGSPPQCVSLRTVENSKPYADLTLSPELTSTVLLLLTLTLLLLALQSWHGEPWEGMEKPHGALLQEVKGHEAIPEVKVEKKKCSAREQTPESSDQPGQEEKGLQQPV